MELSTYFFFTCHISITRYITNGLKNFAGLILSTRRKFWNA